MAEQIGERDTEQECRDHAVDHREPRVALSAEEGIDAEHEADDDAVNAIPTQIAGSHFDDGGIFRENPCQVFGPKLGIEAYRYSEHQRHADAGIEAASHALYQSGAIVLGGHGRDGCGDCRRGQHGKHDNLLHHAQCGGCDYAHLIDDHGDNQERDVNQCILQRNRCTQFYNLSGKKLIGADVLPTEWKVESATMQEPKCSQKADTLRKHGCSGCSGRTHTESAYQQEIDGNIDDASNEHEIERRLRIAQSSQDTAHHVVSHDKRYPDGANQDVMQRVFHRLFRRVHQHRNLLVQQDHDKR